MRAHAAFGADPVSKGREGTARRHRHVVVDEEWVWINKIKAGNHAPFRDLYARHANKLFGL